MHSSRPSVNEFLDLLLVVGHVFTSHVLLWPATACAPRLTRRNSRLRAETSPAAPPNLPVCSTLGDVPRPSRGGRYPSALSRSAGGSRAERSDRRGPR